jgi:hypothetical protein
MSHERAWLPYATMADGIRSGAQHARSAELKTAAMHPLTYARLKLDDLTGSIRCPKLVDEFRRRGRRLAVAADRLS